MGDLVSYISSLGRAEYHISFIPKYRHKIFGYNRIKAVCEQCFHNTAKQYGFTDAMLTIDTLEQYIEKYPKEIYKNFSLIDLGSVNEREYNLIGILKNKNGNKKRT